MQSWEDAENEHDIALNAGSLLLGKTLDISSCCGVCVQSEPFQPNETAKYPLLIPDPMAMQKLADAHETPFSETPPETVEVIG